ncbi:MAG: hypothetical protein R3240_14390, partial [Gammaproteobacteria bacterium]|nr:hypothetical protein [Gammaproteobacteria bacterium]
MKLSTRFTHTIGTILLLLAVDAGANDDHPDNRKSVKVDTNAKEHVLLEMRQLLEAVQLVMDSALKQDMDSVAKHASDVG